MSVASAAVTAACDVSNAAIELSRSRWLASFWSNSGDDPVALATRLLQIRLLDAELRSRTLGFRAKRRWIDAEEQVAGFDGLSFVVAALEQDAGHACADLDFADTAQLRRVLERERQVARLHLERVDLGWREYAGGGAGWPHAASAAAAMAGNGEKKGFRRAARAYLRTRSAPSAQERA